MPDMLKRYWPTLPIAALAALLSLAGCTSIDGEIPLTDGRTAKVSVFRVWTDTSVAMSLPDGTSLNYSSDADTAAAASMNQRLLDALIGSRLVATGAGL